MCTKDNNANLMLPINTATCKHAHNAEMAALAVEDDPPPK